MNKTWIIAALAIFAAALFLPGLFFQPEAPTAASQYVTEVTDANFEAEVTNHDGPVIVEAYATWCGPCKSYKPVYHQAAEAHHNKAKFVSFDGDLNRGIARNINLQAYPTTVCIKGKGADRKVTDSVMGALPPSTLESFIAACAAP